MADQIPAQSESHLAEHWVVTTSPAGIESVVRSEQTAENYRRSGWSVEGPYSHREAAATIDEDALIRATRAVKACRMGRASNRAVVLAVLDALGTSGGWNGSS